MNLEIVVRNLRSLHDEIECLVAMCDKVLENLAIDSGHFIQGRLKLCINYLESLIEEKKNER